MSQINESAIATPGVYVTEIDSFPPSIAQVATAIPVFIGYTQQAVDAKGQPAFNKLVRLSSLVQYTKYFGQGPANLQANVDLKTTGAVNSVTITPSFQMFNAMQMFFNAGGSDCYILSVNTFPTSGKAAPADFLPGAGLSCLDIIEKESEITLIVIPDVVLLDNATFNTLMTKSLALCNKLGDRFTIMDVQNGDQDRDFSATDVIDVFRAGVGNQNLSYGAAYYPWVQIALQNSFSWNSIQVTILGTSVPLSNVVVDNPVALPYITQIVNAVSDATTILKPFITTPASTVPPSHNPIGTAAFTAAPNLVLAIQTADIHQGYDLIQNSGDLAELKNRVGYIKALLTGFINLNNPIILTDKVPATAGGKTVTTIYTNYTVKGVSPNFTMIEQLVRQLVRIGATKPPTVATAIDATITAAPFATYDLTGVSTGDITVFGNPAPAALNVAVANVRGALEDLYSNCVALIDSFYNDVLALINSLDGQIQTMSLIYNGIVTAINKTTVKIPPCGAIAGVYAAVDATRGVWKAPANVSIDVINPAVQITDDMQGNLNIDTVSGKSVNAIRAFTGKGTLIWGSRTLAGNDNNWKYIPVRRFFIMVEESVKLATFQFVFEPNITTTWLRLRAMIENFLTGLWRLGAITGSKPELGFYVKVGLGQTMTQDDILNGKLIVEIGIAPVRPAEFIILRFTQTQQQA